MSDIWKFYSKKIKFFFSCLKLFMFFWPFIVCSDVGFLMAQNVKCDFNVINFFLFRFFLLVFCCFHFMSFRVGFNGDMGLVEIGWRSRKDVVWDDGMLCIMCGFLGYNLEREPVGYARNLRGMPVTLGVCIP